MFKQKNKIITNFSTKWKTKKNTLCLFKKQHLKHFSPKIFFQAQTLKWIGVNVLQVIHITSSQPAKVFFKQIVYNTIQYLIYLVVPKILGLKHESYYLKMRSSWDMKLHTYASIQPYIRQVSKGIRFCYLYDLSISCYTSIIG